MTSAEAVVAVIVVIISLLWDALIVRQILRGETISFSSQTWEQQRTRNRKTEPTAFWTAIGLQAIFPNLAILYLLYFWLSTLAK
ncbi:MAG: hypothetical protein Q7J80_00230 [Anaerolineales bacterium]|nr:hypothetical protein [Anaerolineales bacterium]